MDKRVRLSPDDWIRAGFRALIATGPQSLRAEALARDLGTTKGSFYWHFADVPAFHAAMLETWVTAAEQALPAALAAEPTPAARLRRLGQIGTAPVLPEIADTALEPALRAWAHDAPDAAAAIARVDAARLASLRALLAEMGITNPEIARLLLGAGIGLAELALRDGTDAATPMGSLVDLVLALR
jgi:AcrR family transcriptional regulator